MVTITACVATEGFVSDSSDCDDLDPSVHPDALEQCDGVDNNCDEVVDGDALDASLWYDDLDGDGYGDDLSVPVEACVAPGRTAGVAGDCDDEDTSVHSGAEEVCDEGRQRLRW